VSKHTQQPLRFPAVDDLGERGALDGGAMSSDFGPMFLRRVDRRIGLTDRCAGAFDDPCHPFYVPRPIRTLLAQRSYQIACACQDGNDANTLRG